MPKVIKNVKKKYSDEQMSRALHDVRVGMSINAAGMKHCIPRSTLHNYVNKKYKTNKAGPDTILTSKEESDLEKWLIQMCSFGNPVTKDHLINSVALLIKNKPRPNPFNAGRPGRHWYEAFLRRHPMLSTRLSENVSLSRAQVSEQSVRSWFKEILQFFNKLRLDDICGSRIFNTDETALSFNPKSGSVIAKKGSKNVYSVVGNDEKANLTALVTGNAVGQLAPTMVVYNYKRIPSRIFESFPKDFHAAVSDNGWMTAELFFEYLANAFLPWIKKNNIELPVVLYMDRHVSHMTQPLSEFCHNNQIILIALPANTTHFMQPMDVSMFAPLKVHWKKIVNQYRIDKEVLSVRKEDFAYLLEKTYKNMDLVEILSNGFRKCGLHPFCADNVDYSKIFIKCDYNNKSDVTDESSNHKNVVETAAADPVANALEITLESFENFLEPEVLELFKLSVDENKYLGSLEDTNLYHMWRNFSNSVKFSKKKLLQLTDKQICGRDVSYDLDQLSIPVMNEIGNESFYDIPSTTNITHVEVNSSHTTSNMISPPSVETGIMYDQEEEITNENAVAVNNASQSANQKVLIAY